MKEISRETLVKRAISWSLIQKKYKDIIDTANLLHIKTISRKMENTPKNILVIEEAKRQIEKCKRLTVRNISRLLYADLKEPLKNNQKKVFGEVSAGDYLDEIIKETKYHSVDYISDYELKAGYIFLNQLKRKGIIIEQTGMILNLNTGEYVRATKEEIAKCKPVTPILDKLVRNPNNY